MFFVRFRDLVLSGLLAAASLCGQSGGEEDFARSVQLVGQRHSDEAIPILESVITREPVFYPAYDKLVDAYQQKHALEQASAYFTSLSKDPMHSAFAHYALGRIAELKFNFSESVDHYVACVQLLPNSVPCYVPLVTSEFKVSPRGRPALIQGNPERPYACLAFTKWLLTQNKVSEGLVAAQRCLSGAQSSGASDFLQMAHYLIAEAYIDAGTGYHERLDHHREAARLAAQRHDPEEAFRLNLTVCADYIGLGNDLEADECFGRALTEARSQSNRSWLEESLTRSAAAKSSRGELGPALADELELLDLFKADADFESTAMVLLEIGKIHFLKGDLPHSRSFCEEAHTLALEHGYLNQQAYSLRELSKVYSVSGDPILALRYANESIRIFRQVGLLHQAGAGIGNLPEIYGYMGDWPSALRYAQESLRSATECQDVLEQQDTLAVIGDVLSGMGRYREAAGSYQRSLFLDRVTEFAPFKLTGLMGLGRAYLDLKEYGNAKERLSESMQLARRLGNRRAEAGILAQLGRCYRQLGRLNQSREYFQSALEIASAIPLAEVTLMAQRGLAEMAVRTGDFHGALEHLKAAAQDVESLRSRIPTSDLKADFGRENAKLYEDLLYVLAHLTTREPGKGWDREAFDYAERGRARAFLDLLAESRAQITKGLTTEQLQQRRGLEAALSRALTALLDHDTEVARSAASLAERNLADWVTAIRISNPQYEGLNYPHPADANQAVRLVASRNVTILEYALGDRESYLWLIVPSGLRMFRLPPRATIERVVSEFRKLITRHPDATEFDAWQAPAEALYAMLVAPAQAYLIPERPLLIVPDGALHYLPFETLRSKDNAGRPKCLIEQFPLSYMPSLSVLSELERGPSASAQKFDLLAYGDPVFSHEGAPVTSSSSLVRGIYESGGNHFPQLPNTRTEVQAISRLFPAERQTTFFGLNATESSVKHAPLMDYRLLHFATHAVVDDRNPGRSGIVLSLVNNGDEDGILRMNEIFNLEMRADLVVLSACQTGVGALVRGEGIIGLTRAFLYAGARRVTVSLWDVNDMTTPGFMENFYRHLRQGEGAASALRSAKIAMIHTGPRFTTHPYFWAPFALEAAPD